MAASFEQLLDENLSTVIMKQGSLVTGIVTVSYTHLTLPTNREV